MTHEELLTRWPKQATGEPEEAVFLVNLPVQGDLLMDMTIVQLEAYGIPVLKKRGLPGAIGRLNGVDLYVPASRLEEAAALLEAPEE